MICLLLVWDRADAEDETYQPIGAMKPPDADSDWGRGDVVVPDVCFGEAALLEEGIGGWWPVGHSRSYGEWCEFPGSNPRGWFNGAGTEYSVLEVTQSRETLVGSSCVMWLRNKVPGRCDRTGASNRPTLNRLKTLSLTFEKNRC